MFDTPIQVAGALLTVLVTAAVFYRPSPGSRGIAIANLSAFLLSPLVQNWNDLVSPQWAILAVDVALLAVVTRVLLKFPGRWIQVTWGAMGLTVLAHFAKAVDETLLIRGYIGTLYVLYFVFLFGLAMSALKAGRPGPVGDPSDTATT